MTKPSTTPKDERRIASRLTPGAGTVCRLDSVDAKSQPTIGLVWNISLSGVSMLFGTPPKTGDILTGELVSDSGRATLQVIMRAVHAKPIPTGDFIVGAQFLRELTQAELELFVDVKS